MAPPKRPSFTKVQCARFRLSPTLALLTSAVQVGELGSERPGLRLLPPGIGMSIALNGP